MGGNLQKLATAHAYCDTLLINEANGCTCREVPITNNRSQSTKSCVNLTKSTNWHCIGAKIPFVQAQKI